MTLRARAFAPAVLVIAGLLATAQTVLAYRFSPLIAALIPAAAVLVALILWRPMIGVYLGILVVPLELYQQTFSNLHFSPTEGVLLLTAAAAAAHVLIAGEARQRLHLMHAAFLGLIVVAAVGMVFAPDGYLVRKIVIYWVAFLFISLLVASATRAQLERVLICIAITGGIVGIVALSGGSEQQLIAGGQIATNRAHATFAHPNLLAVFLIMSLPPALALSGGGTPPRRILMLACAGVAVAGLVLTLARGGIIGAAVSLLVMVAWPPFRRAALALLLLLGLFAAFNVKQIEHAREVSLVRERLSTLTSSQGRSINPRVRIWQKTPSMIADHPWFGVGEGNYAIVSPRYGLLDIGGLHYDHAHNIFLNIAAETGLLGLACFLAFVWGMGQAAFRSLRARRPGIYPLALSLVAAMIGLLVTSFGEYPPRTSEIMATIMIEAGALVACERLSRAAGEVDGEAELDGSRSAAGILGRPPVPGLNAGGAGGRRARV